MYALLRTATHCYALLHTASHTYCSMSNKKEEADRQLAFMLKNRTQQEYFATKYMKMVLQYTNNDGVVVT